MAKATKADWKEASAELAAEGTGSVSLVVIQPPPPATKAEGIPPPAKVSADEPE